MTRGLKDIESISKGEAKINCYTDWPDDKGTESVNPITQGCGNNNPVTLIDPMTRGLKEKSILQGRIGDYFCYTDWPDDKGTESLKHIQSISLAVSYTDWPDDKGTESPLPVFHIGEPFE